jgi:3-isopropylmalate/(R)-2-methylmalate dehydratase small subunit
VRPFTEVTGRAVVLDRDDVDTDQIIPAEHLKRIERTGFGAFLFEAWRRDPTFCLNAPGGGPGEAAFLIAGRNFGCGSSREHAVWALEDYGFRAVIAPSFADIFRSNCTKVGLLPVQLDEPEVRELQRLVGEKSSTRSTISLERRTVTSDGGFGATFDIDDHTRHRLLNGLDDIAVTLTHADAIAAYEARTESSAVR